MREKSNVRKKDTYDTYVDVLQDKQTTVSRQANTTRIVYRGEVVDNNDPQNKSRIKIYIPDVDVAFETKKSQLPWCSYFFTTNINHIPNIGEEVVVLLENPWKKDHARWWIGPVRNERFVQIPLNSVSVSARPGNTIELKDDKDIELTTDVTSDTPSASIEMSDANSEIRISSRDIILNSTVNENGEEYAVPYGENLVELLRFILQTLKSHSHPPNSPPTPDFFVQADRYMRDLETFLLNRHVRTRGE